MLDIHLPHKSIRGFSEFLLHLFTITVGLLIAVQIENFVEWRHHMHLAEEARVELRVEIENNLKVLKEHQPQIKMCRQVLESSLAVLQLIQEHHNVPKDQLLKIGFCTREADLIDTAWKTAQNTGALAYMPYEKAEKYASIYQAQSELITMEEKPDEDGAAFLGLTARFHRHVGNTNKLTAEQASAFAESLGQMRMHMADADTRVQNTIERNSAFLEHRKARKDLETNLE